MANHVLMATEINNSGHATLMSRAQLIAKGVGVSTVLVMPCVMVDCSLACTPSPKTPCMVANVAQSRTVPSRTILAAQKSARGIARVIGRIGVSVPMTELVTASIVVQEASRAVVTQSRRSALRVDVYAKQ